MSIRGLILLIVSILCPILSSAKETTKFSKDLQRLILGFENPPDSVKPGVYWYFMDGNISKEGMTKDLESMKHAGIGSLIFLEVNVGVPRGPVTFLSEQWQELFAHAVHEAERLGIAITLGSGPGWAGSGGPWVKPEQSMQHLVASSIVTKGPLKLSVLLEKPQPKKPYFGYGAFTDSLRKEWENYYEDVAVLAYPTPSVKKSIVDIDEKALYYRAPYSSAKGVKQFLPSKAVYEEISGSIIEKQKVIDITSFLNKDGLLTWNVPQGDWTILRFGRRNNGAVTRPAPLPGVGFECDKFDSVAFKAHWDTFVEPLLKKVGKRDPLATGGWKMIHIDSWEMGAQNWSEHFRAEFMKRRNYDPLPFLPVYTGQIVGSEEISERFLWDLRQTAQELVIENHAEAYKNLGRRYGLKLSIEPYDMNPTADLELGAVADNPMCEFWSKGYGFNTAFSCIEATSIAHVNGQRVVQAEAFTAGKSEGWKLYPAAIKNQGDWAFATGINKFYYHTFAHQPLDEKLLPGMTMGPYGVHWDRHQTWWPMANGYHSYIARCSFLLQQGQTVADILYLTPEGSPHVFRAPADALRGNDTIPDRKGFNFDGCSPGALIAKATVKNHCITFPGGASYRLLVLPSTETMTPELLKKIENLLKDGASVIGSPPQKSPSLVNYPSCDSVIKKLVSQIWGNYQQKGIKEEISSGKGKLFSDKSLLPSDKTLLYPAYETLAEILKGSPLQEDFIADEAIRYTHKKIGDLDVYFLSNSSLFPVKTEARFRISQKSPILMDPLTGQYRKINTYSSGNETTTIPLEFGPNESFFILFDQLDNISVSSQNNPNFTEKQIIYSLDGSWKLSFISKNDEKRNIVFKQLDDWSTREEEWIKFYSGIATYRKSFDFDRSDHLSEVYIDLGSVNVMARVKLNGIEIGVSWCPPWQLNISKAIKKGTNELEIEVANLWPNRLIGDEQLPFDGIEKTKWPEWLLKNQPRPTDRISFSTTHFYKKDSPLLPSGLFGPVNIIQKISSLKK